MKNYKILKQAGKGTYASVYKAKDIVNNKFVAIKVFSCKGLMDLPKTTLREISIIRFLNHENILKFEALVVEDLTLNLIVEYVEYDLGFYCYKYKFCIENIFMQLINGLDYLHNNEIIHRDLKPQNILIDKNERLRIADFGLSIDGSRENKKSDRVVTLWYRAPELLKGVQKYSYEIDMWSFGCIILEIILREPIFDGNTESEVLELIKDFNEDHSEIIELLKAVNTPDHIIESALKCLNIDGKKRYTAKELKEKFTK